MVAKILLFLLVLSMLFVLREGIMFYRALNTGKENITNLRLIFLGLSISYIITIIFTGLRI